MSPSTWTASRTSRSSAKTATASDVNLGATPVSGLPARPSASSCAPPRSRPHAALRQQGVPVGAKMEVALVNDGTCEDHPQRVSRDTTARRRFPTARATSSRARRARRQTWATSASDGFASSMYRRRYLSAARSNFRSPFSAYSSTSARASASGTNGTSNAACSAAMRFPGGEGTLEPCAGMAFGGHERTFSLVERGDHEDMSAAAIWSARFERPASGRQIRPRAARCSRGLQPVAIRVRGAVRLGVPKARRGSIQRARRIASLSEIVSATMPCPSS